MQNLFDQIEIRTPGTSTFDLSHDLKTTLEMGKLVPILCQEVLPGDSWQISSESLFRMMPMVAPIMHKVDIYIHYWFVPNRLTWDGWETFITGGEQVGTAPRAQPYLNFSGLSGGIAPSSLANYLGLPASTTLSVFNRDITAYQFAAYQWIWHWFYRDENLQTQDIADITLIDGLNPYADFIDVKRRAWEHDYFTSALPYAQKGAPVEIPLQLTGLSIDVVRPGTLGSSQPLIRKSSDDSLNPGAPSGLFNFTGGSFTDAANAVYYDPQNTLQVDSTTASTLTTINDLRTATAIQKFLEKNMRAGSRYDESLLVHFGVRSRDSRLQKPEYLGGSKSTMAISEVLQTSDTGAGTPQGNMAGHGISVNGGADCNFFAPEHGCIMGILSIMPKTSYYSGVPKQFLKLDRYDFAFQEFAHLGEQEVKQIELVYQGGPDDDDTFGYQPRFTEYRTIPSRVNGQMANTLEYWHLGRNLQQGVPVPLNDQFIECVPDNRIFAVTAPGDNIVAHIFHQIMANRPLPMYGTPGGL